MPATGQHPEDDRFDPYSNRNRQLAIIVLALLGDWPAWMHRRVEQMTFEDPVRVRRQVSVDFTVGSGLAPALCKDLARDLASQPLLFVPLGLLRKRRLTSFSMWDETGCQLPLITSRRNRTLAAAVLFAAAEAEFGRDQQRLGDTAAPPREIADELVAIARSRKRRRTPGENSL